MLSSRPGVYFAGQITGVEGYVESAGSGLVAGINAARRALGLPRAVFPEQTMLGAMAAYVSRGGLGPFVPMNANFGLIAPLEQRVRGGKAAKYAAYAERSLAAVEQTRETLFPRGKETCNESNS